MTSLSRNPVCPISLRSFRAATNGDRVSVRGFSTEFPGRFSANFRARILGRFPRVILDKFSRVIFLLCFVI